MNMKKISHAVFTDDAGMSLIEVLVTMVVLAMVLSPIYEFLRQGALSWEVGENRTEVVQNARIGLDKMCDEIRNARQLYSITSRDIRFWWQDVDADNQADSNEIITYSWSGIAGGDLTRKRDDEASASPIANYVEQFELRYYNETGAETATLADVRLISATLKITKTRRGSDYSSAMRKSVYLRNL